MTLIEVLPKEKKQKEDKFQTLGQASFDLLPLLRGEAKINVKLPIYPVPGSPLEPLATAADFQHVIKKL